MSKVVIDNVLYVPVSKLRLAIEAHMEALNAYRDLCRELPPSVHAGPESKEELNRIERRADHSEKVVDKLRRDLTILETQQ
jgi:hypothetical protein